MRDGRRIRRPREFDPERSNDHYMNFGHGMHWCVGKYIAEAQITQTMKALLLRDNLRPAPGRAGKMRRISFFPRTMFLEYD
jgi:cytochrome P450